MTPRVSSFAAKFKQVRDVLLPHCHELHRSYEAHGFVDVTALSTAELHVRDTLWWMEDELRPWLADERVVRWQRDGDEARTTWTLLNEAAPAMEEALGRSNSLLRAIADEVTPHGDVFA